MISLLAHLRLAAVVAVTLVAGAPRGAEPRKPLRVAVLDFENVSNDHGMDPR